MKTGGKILPIALIAVMLAGFGYGYYRYNLLSKDLASMTRNKEGLEKQVAAMRDENGYLQRKLAEEQNKNNSFQDQISGIASTIGTLDKLSKTDRELLQKYSKVYFLNENYVPESLSDVPADFIYEKSKNIKVHTKMLPFLEKLMQAAKNENSPVQIISGYRSFNDQNSLKQSYKVTFGTGANKFSADQGYSEHQLGTALDFTTSDLGIGFGGFKKTQGYTWLLDNAYKYGFILSYPESNAYYQFEPWHWRFVGVKLATTLHNENQNFYDLDQRTIDNYLINIFD